MMHTDHYFTLGLPRNASAKDIKNAYRALAMRHHPDRNAGDPMAEARFKEINEAYEVLGDPYKRIAYDQANGGGYAQAESYAAADPQPAYAPYSAFSEAFSRTKARRAQYVLYLDLRNIVLICALGVYAFIVLAGSSTLALFSSPIEAWKPYLKVMGVICVFAGGYLWYSWGQIAEYIQHMTMLHFNLIAFGLFFLVLNIGYWQYFELVYGVPPSASRRDFGAIMRTFVFFWWLFVRSPWHWKVATSLCLLIAAAYKKRWHAGWIFLALQLALIGVVRYHSTLMHMFTLYYQPLFTVAPLTPVY